MRRRTLASLFTKAIVIFLPGIAWTQSATTGATGGLVRDATGAVLPERRLSSRRTVFLYC
jgi:hypothetical protein